MKKKCLILCLSVETFLTLAQNRNEIFVDSGNNYFGQYRRSGSNKYQYINNALISESTVGDDI